MTVDNPQQRAELENWIANRIARGVPHDDIIPVVCSRAGLDWPQAEAIVRGVAESRRQEIARKRLPVLLVLSIIIVISGLAMAGSAGIDLWEYASSLPQPLDLDAQRSLALYLTSHAFVIGRIAVGIAMIAGGAIGLGRSFAAGVANTGESQLL